MHINRSVGYVHTGQTAYHTLPLEDVSQCSLRDFALVRSICGDKFAPAGDVWDDRRDVVVVSALSDEYLEFGIHRSELFEVVTHLLLAHSRRKVVFALKNEVRRDVGEQVIKAVDTYSLEHRADIFLRVGEIAQFAHILFGYFAVSGR